jgi:hypothetical protein
LIRPQFAGGFCNNSPPRQKNYYPPGLFKDQRQVNPFDCEREQMNILSENFASLGIAPEETDEERQARMNGHN